MNVLGLYQILTVAKIKPAVLQVENHPFLQQKELVDFCKKNGIAVTAYAPLGAPARPVSGIHFFHVECIN